MERIDFKNWKEAHTEARQRAERDGMAWGIKYNKEMPHYGPWVLQLLPGPGSRFGSDLMCEAVEPSAEARKRYEQRVAEGRRSGPVMQDHDAYLADLMERRAIASKVMLDAIKESLGYD